MSNEPTQQSTATPRRRRAAMTPERVRAAAESAAHNENVQNSADPRYTESSSAARQPVNNYTPDAVQRQQVYMNRQAQPVQQPMPDNRYQQPAVQGSRIVQPSGMQYQNAPMNREQQPAGQMRQQMQRQVPVKNNQGYNPQNGYMRSEYAGQYNRQASPAMVQSPQHYQHQSHNEKNKDKTIAQLAKEVPANKNKKSSKSIAVIIIAVIVALIVIAAVAVGISKSIEKKKVIDYVEPYNDKFCQGVYVDGIHLGGMTADEGVAAVTAQAQQRNDNWSVNLTYQGNVITTITAGQLGMTVDVMDVLQQAWNQGHIGDIYERKASMEQLLVNPYTAYTAIPNGDTAVVDSILQSIQNSLYVAPQDAALAEFDANLSDPFVYKNEVCGTFVNTASIKETLYRMVSTMESGSVQIQTESIQPSVTVEMLKENYSLRATVTTPISKDSTTERTNNIRRCFQQINGYVLQPGEKFSFNKVVGARTLDNGFFEAIEYAYGEHVMGVGGGTCQASTTLYQACVCANLQIISRTPHSDSVSYAEYGQDATVYYTKDRKIDYSFKNSTNHPIYIVAAVQSDPSNRKLFVAKVSIYGEKMEDGVTYGLSSKVIETLEPPEKVEYIKDKNQTYVTYTNQEYVARKAKEGYVVESYKDKYVNGTLVEQTLLYTDRYEAKAKRVYVGTKERN